jgi:predicted nuclease of predicted toxin-antitoxin system
LKFIVDVNVGRRMAEFLAQEGHDVVWVGDLGQETPDKDIMGRSLREQRIILTVDHHFENLASRQHEPFHAILRAPSEPHEQTRTRVSTYLSAHSSDLSRGRVVILTRAGIRIRH